MKAYLPHREANAPIGAIARAAASQSPCKSHEAVRVSFEFFPPKGELSKKRLRSVIQKLAPLNPDFVSVTYGAGGSTQDRTLDTLKHMIKDSPFKPAAHLTCVDATRTQIDNVAKDFWKAGVRHIVALRGDPSTGIGQDYVPSKNGYAYASDLVRGLKKVADFEVSVSAYPERHPESQNWQVEIENLKRKVDAGASRAITQFFFSPDVFWRFQDRVLDAGINIPIVPGIMLQPNFKALKRMADMCGVCVPDWYAELFEGLGDDAVIRGFLTASLASELTAELYDRGVRDFHLYTLNQAEIATSVSRVLGLHYRAKAKDAA
ncbi:MAG: methylenetetrahydrofolate reductase [NAD(P)H] [Litorimonas sp.]